MKQEIRVGLFTVSQGGAKVSKSANNHIYNSIRVANLD